MKFDSYGFIEMEQDSFPGSIGDCCAETSRYITLTYLVGKPAHINLGPFVQGTSQVVRYPSPPSPWGVTDTSDDQTSPFMAASCLSDPVLCIQVIEELESNWYKTGNGQLMHPSSFGQMKRALGSWSTWFLDFFIFCQALIFLFPYTWDDGQMKFVDSTDSYSDYLNFTNYLAFAKLKGGLTIWCRLAMKVIPQSQIMSNVTNYYKPEPNVQWLLDLYSQALTVLYDGV